MAEFDNEELHSELDSLREHAALRAQMDKSIRVHEQEPRTMGLSHIGRHEDIDEDQDTKGSRHLCDRKIESQLKKEWGTYEGHTRLVKGSSSCGAIIRASQLGLPPTVVLPPKFKMPNFRRYGGLASPRAHMARYHRRMAEYVRDEKLMTYCFQNSLGGAALGWYMGLESSSIKRWQDLSDAFVKRYKHNRGLAVNREDLRHMEKKNDESFREYIRRWRVRTAEVLLPLDEGEIISIFLETLRSPFNSNLHESASPNSSSLPINRERMERGDHEDKGIRQTDKTKEPCIVSKDGNRRAPLNDHTFAYAATPTTKVQTTTIRSQAMATVQQSNDDPLFLPRMKVQKRRRQNRTRYEDIDPIPVTYSDIYPQLLRVKLVAPIPYRRPSPPFPKWYNPEARCEYHGRAVGHLINNCPAFKYKVQELVRTGWLKFEEEKDRTDVNKDPLPSHGSRDVNALGSAKSYSGRKGLDDVQMPLAYVCQTPRDNGFIKEDVEEQNLGHIEDRCLYHVNRSRHSLKDCTSFRSKLRSLMDSKLSNVCTRGKEIDMCMTSVRPDEDPNPMFNEDEKNVGRDDQGFHVTARIGNLPHAVATNTILPMIFQGVEVNQKSSQEDEMLKKDDDQSAVELAEASALLNASIEFRNDRMVRLRSRIDPITEVARPGRSSHQILKNFHEAGHRHESSFGEEFDNKSGRSLTNEEAATEDGSSTNKNIRARVQDRNVNQTR